MRLFSTPKTAEKGELTLLSVIETILAVCIASYMIYKNESLSILIFPVCLAPLLLLRTKESTLKSISLAEDFYKNTNLTKPALLAVPPFYIFKFLAIKIYALIFTVLKSPIKSLASIPSNLWRVTMCTDTCHVPELIPGMELYKEKFSDEHKMFLFGDFIESIKIHISMLSNSYNRRNGYISVFIETLLFSIVIMILLSMFMSSFLFSMIYRWSLKSTSIIYIPLIWIINPIKGKKIDLSKKLEIFITQDVTKFTFVMSVLVIILFVMKYLLLLLIKNNTVINYFSTISFLDPLIEPTIIPIWQLSSFINSILFIILLLYIRSKYNQIKVGVAQSDKTVDTVMSWSLLIRRILTLYTVICTIYILITTITSLNLPSLGTNIFPW